MSLELRDIDRIVVLPGRRAANPQRVASLARSIEVSGLLSPIVVDENGVLVAGLHRLRACEQLGWPAVPVIVRPSRAGDFEGCDEALADLGLTAEAADRRLAEIDENLVRNELTALERGEQLAERKRIYEARWPETVSTRVRGGPGRATDERREKTNDSVSFVSEARRARAADPEPEVQPWPEDDVDEPAPPTFAEDAAARMGVSPRTIQREVQVGNLPEDVREIVRGTELEDNATELRRIASKKDPEEQRRATIAALTSSKTNEWYTPGEYVEAARELMGGIDLDPASCPLANETVQATTFYTIEDDGWSKEWAGRVWMNPVYGTTEKGESNQARWTERLIDDYEQGEVNEAVFLVNSKTGDAWFEPLWRHPICFVRRRIKFVDEHGQKQKQPTQANVLVYLGSNVERFVELFSKFGRIVVPDGAISRVVA